MSRYSIAVQVSLLWLAATVVGQNPLISNGTCYYAAGKQANSAYIPCGNSAFGVYSCCEDGDTCLSSNACYDAKYGVTYLAGCTDPTYSDGSCPYKGMYGSNEWVSLVRCFVSNNTAANNEQWAPCNEPSQPLVSKPSGGCTCNAAASTAVFTDNPSLTNHAVLPSATGLSISWDPGFTPPTTLKPTKASTTSSSSATSTSSSSTSSTSRTSTSSSSSTSSATTTSSSSSSSAGAQGASTTGTASSSSSSPSTTGGSNGLSVGAEVGIGLGIGLGVLAVCAVLFLLYRRRVKKRQTPVSPDPRYSAVPHADDKMAWGGPPQSQAPPRPDVAAGPAWAGYKSELSGDNSISSPSNRASMPPSELATSESSRPWSQSNASMGYRPTGGDPRDSTGHTMISTASGSGSAGAWDSQGVSLMSNWNNNPNFNVRDPRLQHQTIHELSG